MLERNKVGSDFDMKSEVPKPKEPESVIPTVAHKTNFVKVGAKFCLSKLSTQRSRGAQPKNHPLVEQFLKDHTRRKVKAAAAPYQFKYAFK